MIADALPTALIGYCSSSHAPNEYISPLPTKTNNTIHLSATLRADATSGALLHRASSIRTADRLELNRPDVVSLKRGLPIILSVGKKKRSRLALAVQHPARLLICIVIRSRSVRGPWPTTSMYLVRLVRTHIYGFWAKSHVIPTIFYDSLDGHIQPRALSLRNLVSGYECGRVFPAGVGPGSPPRDAAN